MLIRDIGEIQLIKRLTKGLRLDKTVIKGPGDDTAVIEWTRDKYMLLTCDMLVEDVHFKLREAAPFQIGWKALGRNLSDIAAMGGVPRYAVVSAGLPRRSSVGLAEGVFKGIRTLADRFKVNIVGGDMTDSEKLVIDIALIGEVEKGNLATRHGAKPGDLIFVTGSIGGSIKGKHLRFVPRLDEARRLVSRFKINSMIDVSDGLEIDLWRILEASGVGARVYRDAVPLSKHAGLLESAITDGEDFELLFTMSRAEARKFFRSRPGRIKTPVTYIGEIMPKKYGYRLVMESGAEKCLGPKGYLHFVDSNPKIVISKK